MKKIIKENANVRFNKLIITSFISTSLMAILGFVFLFEPEFTNRSIGILVGIVILIKAFSVIYKFVKRDGTRLYLLNILYGIILAIIGVLIIVWPMIVSTFLTLMLGLFLIILGSNKVTYGIWFKIANSKAWFITCVTGLFMIGLGILAIVNPFTTLTITSVIGSLLLLTSALDFSNTIMMKRNAKNIVEMFW